MKKIIFAYAALVIVLILIAVTKTGNISNFLQPTNKNPNIAINSKTFNLMLAKTDDEKFTGLSKTSKLEANQGMLFIFKDKDYHPFWMKNMKFPIDIIFIDDSKIVDMYENLKPASDAADMLEVPIYKPKNKANYVLEISSGLSKKYNFKINDKITLNNVK